MGKRIYIVAGEVSGDTHGSGLMRSLNDLQPDCEFSGAGGPKMAELADGVEDWVDEAGVVGLWEVLKNYRYFKRRFDSMLSDLVETEPDALILIDYPGFNLRFAKAVRESLPKIKIIFYISPQVWAWKKGRVPKMAKLLDLMICIFPFEKQLYEGHGLKTVFAGHPMVDRLAEFGDSEERESDLVGLFPGSRTNEVGRLFPSMLMAANELRGSRPGTKFVASAASELLAGTMASERKLMGWTEDDCPIEVGTSQKLMRKCSAGAVASGTATLESTVLGMPYCLVYRVNWMTYVVGKTLVRIKHLGMANILAGREIIRELVQGDLTPSNLSSELSRLLDDTNYRSKLKSDLAEAASMLGEGNAYERAATAVMNELNGSIQ